MVYAIVNIVTNRRYIGSTINCYNRFRIHKWMLQNNRHHCKYLQNVWNKYGKSKFNFIILAVVPIEQLAAWEQWHLDITPLKFNILPFAYSGNRGRQFTTLHKKKIGLANLGKKRTPEQIATLSLAHLGNKLPQEQIEKIRAAGFGRKHTETSKLKMQGRKTSSASSSYLGVFRNNNKWKNKWVASVKGIRLGVFNDEISAALAYDQAALFYYGKDAKINFMEN